MLLVFESGTCCWYMNQVYVTGIGIRHILFVNESGMCYWYRNHVHVTDIGIGYYRITVHGVYCVYLSHAIY